jgi:hypothetical protein
MSRSSRSSATCCKTRFARESWKDQKPILGRAWLTQSWSTRGQYHAHSHSPHGWPIPSPRRSSRYCAPVQTSRLRTEPHHGGNEPPALLAATLPRAPAAAPRKGDSHLFRVTSPKDNSTFDSEKVAVPFSSNPILWNGISCSAVSGPGDQFEMGAVLFDFYGRMTDPVDFTFQCLPLCPAVPGQ